MPSTTKNPYSGFRFSVEMQGLLAGGFHEVSGLESQTNVETITQGGMNQYAYKLPGPTTYANLVLSRGLSDANMIWQWYAQVVQGNIQRKRITLHLLDREGVRVMSWDFQRAWPMEWRGPQFNAVEGAVATESLTLAYEYFQKTG